MISVAISCHYFFGKDQRTAELEKILPRFPPWAFPSYWVSTYNMYRYWGTARHHSASQRQMPRRVVTYRAAVQSREQRYQALVRRTEPWGLFHTDTIESIHTNAHTLKHTRTSKQALPPCRTDPHHCVRWLCGERAGRRAEKSTRLNGQTILRSVRPLFQKRQKGRGTTGGQGMGFGDGVDGGRRGWRDGVLYLI